MRKIIDQFTNLPISRQRKLNLRKGAAGLCRTCGSPHATEPVRSPFCAPCLLRGFEAKRKRNEPDRIDRGSPDTLYHAKTRRICLAAGIWPYA